MIYKIHGAIQNYAWGGYEYIPHLLHQTATDKPVAELWFGDHPQAPSLIETEQGKEPLDQWIYTHSAQVLSPNSRTCYGNRLPYLLKILDVRLPLSIQLHPNKQQAQTGFAKEEAAGIARNAPQRNYQDDNHKPEMMIALSEFWLLHGFADIRIIQDRLSVRPSLRPVLDIINHNNLHDAYAQLITASQDNLAAWLLPILQQPAPKYPSDNPDYWLCYTVQAMDISLDALDPGLLSFYLFNIVRMQEGEGIFQPACLPHAYLRGQNIELMSGSNNVLRAGLTPKHIDIPEVLRIINSSSIVPNVIAAPPAMSKGLYHYPAPIKDFIQQTIRLTDGEVFNYSSKEASVILNLSNTLYVQCEEKQIALQSAEAVLLTAGSQVTCRASGNCYAVFPTNQ